MAEEIHSVTSSEWKLVQQRLDDLENIVKDLKSKLEILGECKCNRSDSNFQTQHSDDEETQTTIGLNPHSNPISAASGILGDSGQSTFELEETMTSGMPDAHNTPDSAATLTTGSNLSVSISVNTDDDGKSISTKSPLRFSNGIGFHGIEKYCRAQLKLTRFDQAEVAGTSSTSKFRIASSKSTLTSIRKESPISSKKIPVRRRKENGVRADHSSVPPSSHEKRFVCNFCSKRFGRKFNLTQHIRLHTGDKPFHCNNCSMKFNQKSHLTSHAIVHTGAKPFQCSTCSMKFARKSSLRSHTRVHTGDIPFECGFCSKKFRHKDSLTIHTRLHTGDKPFECVFCPKKFKQSQHLTGHMRCHTGERPYACQLCSKTFAVPSTLRLHLNVHTREKPYSCPFCPELFARNRSLKLHLKKHPGETPQRQGQELPGPQP